MPTSAVAIAIKLLLSTIGPFGPLAPTPTHLAMCWDGEAKRDKGRAEKPGGFHEGKQELIDLLAACLGCAHALPEKEADDAVATIVARLEQDPSVSQIYVVSGDKDLQQLVSDKTAYFSLRDKCVMSWARIVARWKVPHPAHIAIALAILGDASDAISGVKGWGGKKVERLFASLTDTTSVTEAYDTVVGQMKPEQKAVFDECLWLTLLDREIPGMPAPAVIRVSNLERLDDCGLGYLKPRFYALDPSIAVPADDGVDAL